MDSKGIEARIRSDGGISYRVKWRTGGTKTGHPESETFPSTRCATKAEQDKANRRAENEARKFRAAVVAAGFHWPRGYVAGIGWNEEAYAALLAAEPHSPAEPVQTFAQFATKWVDHLTGIEERTRADYGRDIALHMIPVFGHLDIADERALDEFAVKSWVNTLESGIRDPDGPDDIEDPEAWLVAPKAPKTIANLHATLFAIMKAAVRAKLRTDNPCEQTRLPRNDGGADGDDEEMVFLSRAEFALLLAAAAPDVRTLLIVAVYTGMRWSELSALQIRDLYDLDGPKPYLRVRRAWKRQPDGTFELGPPKSKRSRRKINLNPSLAAVLAALIEGRKPKDFVFVTAYSGVPWRHNQFRGTRWQPTVYRAMRCQAHRDEDGLKNVNKYGVLKEHLVPCGCPGMLQQAPRIHDLRHTHVAWLILDKTHITAIQRRLGHESVTTTSDRYGHLLPEVEDAVTDSLEDGWNMLPPVIPEPPPV